MSEFINGINISYDIKGKTILENINISLYNNEFVSLVGDNGSGKTTLGKVLMGIYKPTKGEVYIERKSTKDMKLSEIGRVIGYLFQNPNQQIFAPTVEEELSFAMKYKNISENEIKSRVEEMLEAFELTHIRKSKSYFLSRGEKQRVALATILLNQPKYMVLDEPTTALDSKRKKELSNIFDNIRDMGIGVMMISHDLEFIERHSDRIIELKNGRIANE